MSKKSFTTQSVQDTIELGKRVISEYDSSTVFCLYGDLGSGKTHFVKGAAAECGVDENEVHSPTFGIIHEYEGQKLVFHIDAYRIKSEREAVEAGIEACFAEDAIILIEWPEKIAGLIPGDAVKIHFEKTGPETRNITIII